MWSCRACSSGGLNWHQNSKVKGEVLYELLLLVYAAVVTFFQSLNQSQLFSSSLTELNRYFPNCNQSSHFQLIKERSISAFVDHTHKNTQWEAKWLKCWQNKIQFCAPKLTYLITVIYHWMPVFQLGYCFMTWLIT